MSYSYIIVDDDPIFTLLLKKQLQKYSKLTFIDSFRDSASAVLNIQKIKPDLLFLDWNIDSFNGSDIIESISHNPVIVLISSDPYLNVSDLPEQVTFFLQKPIKNEKALKHIIRQAVDIAEANRLLSRMVS